jgi:type I restriction enzyme S subunit
MVSPAEWGIVIAILRNLVPHRTVWAFGSRARFTAKPYSDLDLVILGDQALSLEEMADLNEAFSESDLTYKVDVVDWFSASEAFKEIMGVDHVVILEA